MSQLQSYFYTATQENPKRQSLHLKQSIPLFVVPAAMMFIANNWGIGFLESLGYSSLTSFFAALTIPLALLFVAAIYGYHEVEGHPLTWKCFRERMRYPKLQWRDLAWVLLILVVGTIGTVVTAPVAMFFANAGLVPQNLPILLHTELTPDMLHVAAGGTLHGNWGILALYAVYLFFNIVGEELWWRGYILPRQEQAHGRWTWLIHGTLWTCFHAFRWWDFAGSTGIGGNIVELRHN